MSSQPVTLKERHWRIFSQAGTFETVKAKGVVGQVKVYENYFLFFIHFEMLYKLFVLFDLTLY